MQTVLVATRLFVKMPNKGIIHRRDANIYVCTLGAVWGIRNECAKKSVHLYVMIFDHRRVFATYVLNIVCSYVWCLWFPFAQRDRGLLAKPSVGHQTILWGSTGPGPCLLRVRFSTGNRLSTLQHTDSPCVCLILYHSEIQPAIRFGHFSMIFPHEQ